MKYQDILELKKRIDFNLTEPEVLVKLVEGARSKGEKAQEDMRRLRGISSKIVNIFEEKGLLLKGEILDKVEFYEKRTTIGIDGSFQLVGGAGGIWYAPISVARIIFENGFGDQPRVDIFWADIQEISETEDNPNPKSDASLSMLIAESKAIFNWGAQGKQSFVFIDGPIVDPPAERGEDYVKYRCDGIKKCLEKSILIGCVKRSRDRFYIKYLENLFSDNQLKIKDNLNKFLTDQHLMLYLFSHIRSRGYPGPVFTKWIDISSVNETYESYKKHGVYIVCLFFQKSKESPVLRLDIPLLNPPENDHKTDEIVLQAVKATDKWTYPGQDYPLPVILAHEKCNIREGCAQVLYEEIITKSRTADPYDQLVLMQLR